MINAAPPLSKRITPPDLLTLVVLFAIYTNLSVLGIRFHGLPTITALLIPGLLLVPLYYHLRVRREKIIMPAGLPWLILFLVTLMVGTVLSRDIDAAFSELITYLTEGVMLYLLFTNLIRNSAMLRMVIWAMLAAAIVLGGVPLFQQVTGTFDNNYGGLAQTSDASFRTGEESLQGDIRQPRLSGAVGEINRFAQVMLMLLPLGLFRFFAESSRLLRAIALFATAMAGAGMVLAFSRGTAIAFVLMILLMVIFKVIRPVQLVGFIAIAALLLVAVPQYSARLLSIQSITSLVSGENSGGEDSSPDGAIRGRLTVMMAAALVYADHPLFGVGPGMFSYYAREYSRDIGLRNITQDREAHSLYLGLAAESGSLGLIFFLIMLFVTLRDLLWVRKHSHGLRPDLENIATTFILALVAYLTTGLFLHLSYMRFFWVMFSLASAAGFVARQELRQVLIKTNPVWLASRPQPTGTTPDWTPERMV